MICCLGLHQYLIDIFTVLIKIFRIFLPQLVLIVGQMIQIWERYGLYSGGVVIRRISYVDEIIASHTSIAHKLVRVLCHRVLSIALELQLYVIVKHRFLG